MKLCKDCKHRNGFDRCIHPRFGKWTDYVHGKDHPRSRSCNDQRDDVPWWISWTHGFDRCGPEARYYEPELVKYEMLTGQVRIDAVRAGRPDFRVVNCDEDIP